MVRSYLACVAWMDELIGEMVTALDASPHAGNTIVVVLSDHGYHLFTKHRVGKHTPWAESTRVPFMIRAPWLAPRVVRNVVSTGSLMATIADLAGFPGMASLGDYPHLQPLLANATSASWPNHDAHTVSFLAAVLHTPSYTLVRSPQREGTAPFLELYRRRSDRGMIDNIAGDLPEVAERLRNRLESVTGSAP